MMNTRCSIFMSIQIISDFFRKTGSSTVITHFDNKEMPVSSGSDAILTIGE